MQALSQLGAWPKSQLHHKLVSPIPPSAAGEPWLLVTFLSLCSGAGIIQGLLLLPLASLVMSPAICGILAAAAAAAAAVAAKSLQSCPTLCNPIDGNPPTPPFLGFFRQEHWSGLPLPSPMHEREKYRKNI